MSKRNQMLLTNPAGYGQRMLSNYVPLDHVNNFVEKTADRLIRSYIMQAKQKFGKEYYFYSNFNTSKDGGGDDGVISTITNDFIKKYDKNFEKHSSKTTDDSDNRRIQNIEFFIPVPNENGKIQTFIYVAAGNGIQLSVSEMLTRGTTSPGDIYMYIFGKKAFTLAKELDELTKDHFKRKSLGLFTIDANDRGKDGTRKSLSVTWTEMSPRGLDTLFFSHKEKDIITDHIDRFNDQKDFYADHQILYKTGILFYGKPGTGKTTLAKAIATKYNRDLVSVNVAHLQNIDLLALSKSITVDTGCKYIVLLEDIDTLYLNREGVGEERSNREESGITNSLLQFLDSNASPNDVIFIATTNHVDRLDEALTRKGRFDIQVCIDEIDSDTVIEFAESFGVGKVAAQEVMEEYIRNTTKAKEEKIEQLKKAKSSEIRIQKAEEDLAEWNATPDNEKLYNQSSMQGYLLSKLENKSHDTSIKDTSEEIEAQLKAEQAALDASKNDDEEDW